MQFLTTEVICYFVFAKLRYRYLVLHNNNFNYQLKLHAYIGDRFVSRTYVRIKKVYPFLIEGGYYL